MQLDLNFSDRHLMVFGGTTGINFGIAQAFARQNAHVTVVSRKAQNVDAAVAELRGLGAGGVLGLTADVRDFDALAQVFATAVNRFGLIDVLISGAAGNFLCEAKDMSANGFSTVVGIDLIGTFNVLRQAHGHLRRPGASVVSISAPQASVPMRYQAHCGAAKAGVDQLTRILALEWGEEGMRVNAISPGPVEGTEGFRRLMASDARQYAFARDAVPLRRFATLDDIANLALFLSSPYGAYISGAVIPCDGGGALESVKPALEAAGRAAKETA